MDVAANAPNSRLPLRCPRCQRVNVRREGAAQSSVDWFACLSCSHVWSSASHDGVPARRAPVAAQHILVIDDDDAVVSVVTAYLRDYRVSACVDPRDALNLFQHEPVDLLIVDFLMPTIPGDELVRLARAIRPDLPVLIISGYAAAVRAIGLKGVHVLEKPFTRSELLEAIALAQSIELSSSTC